MDVIWYVVAALALVAFVYWCKAKRTTVPPLPISAAAWANERAAHGMDAHLALVEAQVLWYDGDMKHDRFIEMVDVFKQTASQYRAEATSLGIAHEPEVVHALAHWAAVADAMTTAGDEGVPHDWVKGSHEFSRKKR